MHLFAYGSLMCEDIVSEVAGEPLLCEPARLEGFVRRAIKGEEYPGMIALEGESVPGAIIRNVSGAGWQRLDAFEGEMYDRQQVQVMLADGSAIAAQTYVIRPEYVHVLEAFEWDFEAFLKSGKARFEQHYKGWDSV
ncbi:gamma-glutamylcyclotransferase [Spongiibacter sp. KMU-158]|uniref:Putative gamma-glutamylcyclotransferase n=1 Tax=Spongiibacter pelagi TaxID=2760804 RepID=A0A927C1S0_9GAMM|nr:gamma-glutamylcyclotransferase family protein [Spongiibacter pelagi]MBD2859693.1 gamma-glutamylcyclotransferase [Spongiibacter pelagi]